MQQNQQIINLKKKLNTAMIILIILPVVGVISIPLLVLSLTGVIPGGWFLATPCIILIATNFYGMPIGWVQWVRVKAQSKILIMIVADGETSIKELASIFQRTMGIWAFREQTRIANMKRVVAKFIYKRYLIGYRINGDNLIYTGKSEKSELHDDKDYADEIRLKCVSCGANLESADGSGKVTCKYCGESFIRKLTRTEHRKKEADKAKLEQDKKTFTEKRKKTIIP